MQYTGKADSAISIVICVHKGTLSDAIMVVVIVSVANCTMLATCMKSIIMHTDRPDYLASYISPS